MSDHLHAASPAPAAPPRKPQSRVAPWVLAPVFLIGLLIGALVVGLLSTGPASGSRAATATTSQATSTPPTTQRTLELVVNDACIAALRDINGLLDQVGQLRDAAGQVLKQFSVNPMNELLQRLDTLQRSLRSSFAVCHVDVHLPDGSVQVTDLFAPTTPTSTG